ncbi:FMN-linked oxidoreductase [Thozetella sp. PMI_491]|nr:FMN-linked oxidoreductase [Thozetella sp. PMI_491]
MANLLEPLAVGKTLALRNRVVMASMTRNRCIDDFKPGPAHVKHYSERARHGTGLIITEGILIDWAGMYWHHVPFMMTEEHCEAWQKVVEAVHNEGGKIFMQAWHAGRCQNDQMPVLKNTGRPVLAPSSIKAEGGRYYDLPGSPGHTDKVTSIENPRDVVEQYRHSVRLAKKAGFDGVELLALGGYLPHQFLISHANVRTDSYGGSVENRCRFVLEIVDAIAEVFEGYECICVKLGPVDVLHDSVIPYEESKETYTHLIGELVARKVGIIALSRRGATSEYPRPEGYPLPQGYDPILDFGKLVKCPGSSSMLMVTQQYAVEEAERMLKDGTIDMVAFGRPFIYNPDVITRIQAGVPFAGNDRGESVNYGPYDSPDENYNDWPAFNSSALEL